MDDVRRLVQTCFPQLLTKIPRLPPARKKAKDRRGIAFKKFPNIPRFYSSENRSTWLVAGRPSSAPCRRSISITLVPTWARACRSSMLM